MTLEKKFELLCDRLSNLENENKILRDENHVLQEKVDYLTKKLYGRSSEQTSVLIDGQISFFDEVENEADKNAP